MLGEFTCRNCGARGIDPVVHDCDEYRRHRLKEMYTLDEFIRHLQELREVAHAGGETPVARVIDAVAHVPEADFEEAGAELQYVEDEQPSPGTWEALGIPRTDGRSKQVVSIF